MELINLLNASKWDEDAGFSTEEIQRAMRKKVSRQVGKLIRFYYRSVLLNLLFLLFFASVYFFNPTVEFLIPVVVIGVCFTVIVTNVLSQLFAQPKLTPTISLKEMIRQTLVMDRKIHRRQRRYTSLILLLCFVGGFLLGLAFQGWTIAKYLEKPLIFPVLAVLTTGFFFLTKSASFAKFSRLMNPGYHETKHYLEEQLKIMESDD